MGSAPAESRHRLGGTKRSPVLAVCPVAGSVALISVLAGLWGAIAVAACNDRRVRKSGPKTVSRILRSIFYILVYSNVLNN